MKNLRPNLMVKDVNATVDYYKDIFGATLLTSVPEVGKFDFAIIKIGEVELMLEVVESLSKGIPTLQNIEIGGSFTLYVDVADVQELYDKVVSDSKSEIVKDLHDTFYGTREFYMKDMNGYIFTFAETK